ncbi:PDR/VanB family oxidoreductase [Candidatus Viadribacter manganicus]|uniref:Ferredoxin n=1 Tax=Candidatus Viadribacter manganicus TaxID=1759059 RepID=A0A1B1ALX3_9PROT|nr:PDR/VanB family oxidoreductase [Candidatus Viadribacter manganicus]ANP47572.1 ferredoxin [Candidatus Viadribacter manganicus]
MTKLRMRLAQIAYAARDTNIYTFTPLDGATLPPAEAGAHIDLFLRPHLVRQYSLLQPSSAPGAYVIGVKKDVSGRGGSRYVHEQLRVGDEIEISAPRNNFPLVEDAAHSVLLAGGIGITPIWAMAQRLQALGASWRLYASNRSRQDTALLAELQALPNATLHFDDESGGFLDLVAIIAAAPANTHFYCCGPAPMLAAYHAALAHLPAQFVHDEAFTLAPPPPGGDSEFIVRLARSGREIAVGADTSILDALRGNGVDTVSSCEAGVCGTCETHVIEGEVDHRDHVMSADEQAENTRMMICCSRAKSKLLVLDI